MRATGLIPTSQVKANITDELPIASDGANTNTAPLMSLEHGANCLNTVVAMLTHYAEDKNNFKVF